MLLSVYPVWFLYTRSIRSTHWQSREAYPTSASLGDSSGSAVATVHDVEHVAVRIVVLLVNESAGHCRLLGIVARGH